MLAKRFSILYKQFNKEECGQDYSEYALMLAFVTMFASALFLLTVNDIDKIWAVFTSYLSLASN